MRKGVSMNTNELIVALGGLILIGLITCLIYYILMVVAYWRIFNKAGEAGWKSIIPFLNVYTMYKIAWDGKMFWTVMGLDLISSSLVRLNNGVLLAIAVLAAIGALVIGIMLNFKLARAFGKGTGFAIGLILLNPIFILILAFGSSRYIGAGSDDQIYTNVV